MRRSLLLAVAVAVVAPAMAASIPPVVQAERAFIQMAQEKGVKAAFLANIADDGIMFTPEPVPGKPVLAAWPEGGSLKWWPVYTGMAASGDLGFNTGPYVLEINGQKGYGHFFTVWQRQPDGSWKWLLDHGIQTRKASPIGPDAALTSLPAAPKFKKVAAGDAWAEVTAAETKLAGALASDAKSALAEVLVDDGRVMRSGSEPAIGRPAFMAALASGPATIRVAPLGGKASKAGDLAFSYGTADWQRDGKDRHGHYVRIWQRRGDGWRVVVDELVVAPPPPPAKTAS